MTVLVVFPQLFDGLCVCGSTMSHPSVAIVGPSAMSAPVDTFKECFCGHCPSVPLRCFVSSSGTVFWQCSSCRRLVVWKQYVEFHGVPSSPGNIPWFSPPPPAPGSVDGEESAAPSSSTEARPDMATAVAPVDSQLTRCHICQQELHMQVDAYKKCILCLGVVHAFECCHGCIGCWKNICEGCWPEHECRPDGYCVD